MARSLSQSVLSFRLITKPHPSSSRLLAVRTQSNQPNPSDSSDSSSDPLLRKLEDAIHRIIVRRSAPDWLPFIPGSFYWVPPSTAQSYGLAQLVEKLANPLTSEESMCTTAARGWPSSDYFIKGSSRIPKLLVVD
ncbi:Putative sugar uptake [Gossypium arboreum]|uniref:Putative sugar uptake n=1 Tax=Gossypium arboreum TaxID=29729 RepID=A0A0B0N9H1_GOSAR|nr:Putative sugar uptake [Gossypium arboreum]